MRRPRAPEDEGTAFYDKAIAEPYHEGSFAWAAEAQRHPFYRELTAFVEAYGLADAHTLEIGSGRGGLQDIVQDYVATDIAESAGRWMKKPFVRASATALPFGGETFDMVWSNYVLEHVARPERMLSEIRRVLKPGGYVFMSARWQAAPWLAQGYPVRPWSDFDWTGKLIKASTFLRGSLIYRAAKIVPRRVVRLVSFLVSEREMALSYRALEPNFEENWMPDATAACSVEPFDVYLWFASRGATCVNYPTLWRAISMRTGPLIFRMPLSSS